MSASKKNPKPRTDIEQAEQCYQDIMENLTKAEGGVEAAARLFEKLLGAVRQLTDMLKQLQNSSQKQTVEHDQVVNALENTRNELTTILERFPADILPANKLMGGDVVSDARAAEAGTWNLIQRLKDLEKDRDAAKNTLNDVRKAADKERDKIEKMKKAVADAEAALKAALGDTKADNLEDLINELRQFLEKIRREKAEIEKQRERGAGLKRELTTEAADLNKVLQNLFEKCGDIDRAVAEFDLKGIDSVPKYKTDGDDPEQFEGAIKWLLDVTKRLIDELRETKGRLQESEDKRKKAENAAQKAEEEVKNQMGKIAELNDEIQKTEADLRVEVAAGDAASKATNVNREMYKRHLENLEEFTVSEETQTVKMTTLLKELMKVLDKSMKSVKNECVSNVSERVDLAEKIDKLLAELRNLALNYGDGAKTEDERAKELDREEQELESRLEASRNKFKEADAKRRSLADQVRALKKELDNMAVNEHELEEQANANHDDYSKTQAEILRQNMENEQLAEKVEAGNRALQTREKMLNDMKNRQDDMEVELKRLENENQRLTWRQVGDESAYPFCSKCEEAGDLKPEAEIIQSEIEALKASMDKLLDQIRDGEDELNDLQSQVSSVADREPTPGKSRDGGAKGSRKGRKSAEKSPRRRPQSGSPYGVGKPSTSKPPRGYSPRPTGYAYSAQKRTTTTRTVEEYASMQAGSSSRAAMQAGTSGGGAAMQMMETRSTKSSNGSDESSQTGGVFIQTKVTVDLGDEDESGVDKGNGSSA